MMGDRDVIFPGDIDQIWFQGFLWFGKILWHYYSEIGLGYQKQI